MTLFSKNVYTTNNNEFTVIRKCLCCRPKVVQGQIDPALSAQGPSHPTLIPKTHSYTTELKLTPNVTGERQACVQTEDSGYCNLL